MFLVGSGAWCKEGNRQEIRLLKPVPLIKGTTVARTALTYTEREDGDGQITKNKVKLK